MIVVSVLASLASLAFWIFRNQSLEKGTRAGIAVAEIRRECAPRPGVPC